jgi:serine/threonine-protein kinase HipA
MSKMGIPAMDSTESGFGVWIGERRAGTIRQRGDRTRFSLDEEYREDPDRPVLGLIFEERPTLVHSGMVRLAPWFSNLLPEGKLRDWIAAERDVNRKREMELLAQVGHDLPGAVRVVPEEESPADLEWEGEGNGYGDSNDDFYRPGIRFSLAGVALKFSMLKMAGGMTVPGHGENGDWIVKLPDSRFRDVPRNEFTMMSLAREVGIDVPEIMLVSKESVDGRLPASVWPRDEEFAYAIKRFDRDVVRGRIHIEDLAQVRNIYPERKYATNFETVASLIYRRRDAKSLLEFVRRLTFSILITNGDSHLKNWSLIYRDIHIPTLAPAYDLVSTGCYPLGDRPEDLGLKFGGTRDFHRIGLGTFKRLEERLGARGLDLAGCAVATVDRTVQAWPQFVGLLGDDGHLQDAIDQSIRARSSTLLGRARR